MRPSLYRLSPRSDITSRRRLLQRGLGLGVSAALSSGMALPRHAQAINYLEDAWLKLALRYTDNQVEWEIGCSVGFTSDERIRADNYGVHFRLYAEFWEQDQGRDSWVDGDDGMWTLPSIWFGEDENNLPPIDEKVHETWWWGDAHRDYFDRDSGSEDEIYALIILYDPERDVTLQTLQTRVYDIRA